MRRVLTAAVLAIALVGPAAAECYVEYKARRDAPFRLHYGIIRLDDAACRNPAPAIARRIARDGWQLLTVMGNLSRAEAERRKADAGAYYLRY